MSSAAKSAQRRNLSGGPCYVVVGRTITATEQLPQAAHRIALKIHAMRRGQVEVRVVRHGSDRLVELFERCTPDQP